MNKEVCRPAIKRGRVRSLRVPRDKIVLLQYILLAFTLSRESIVLPRLSSSFQTCAIPFFEGKINKLLFTWSAVPKNAIHKK